jgi:threonine dehydratase
LICGLITTRDLLGLKTEIVGVVARNAPAMALSFAAGKPVPTNSAQTFADGMATRDPREEAVTIIKCGAARVLQLDEDDIAEAVRAYFREVGPRHSSDEAGEQSEESPLRRRLRGRS